eukprot:9505955-Alexandrium_andersonii.AAC.1
MDEAAKWLAGRVQSLGLRTTSLNERARAVGLGNYARSLALTDQQAGDALGNAFDKGCILRRMDASLTAALSHPVPVTARPPERAPGPE